MRLLLTLLFATLIASGGSAHAADLNITLTDLRNTKGQIAIAIYDNGTSFKESTKATPPYTMLLSATGTKAITLHDFPAGTYAISILHDEDKDGTLDVNERQLPLEGYAYSNNVGGTSEPLFKDASFTHTSDADTKQTIKMIYIK